MFTKRFCTFNDIKKLNTGSIKLDYILNGGYPIGRIIEISGKQSSNKSVLALHAAKQAQKQDKTVVYIDTDRKISSYYLKSIGINEDTLYFAYPKSLEETINITNNLINDRFIDLIIIDNVSNLIAQKNIDSNIIDYDYSVQNRMFNKFLYNLSSRAKLNNTTVIFINQYRNMINKKTKKTCIKPLHSNSFDKLANIRMSIKKCNTIKNDLVYMGENVEVTIHKSFYPVKTDQIGFDVLYNSGIDNIKEIVELAVQLNIIQQSGIWYKLNDKAIGQGLYDTKQYLYNNDKTLKYIIDKIKEEENDYEFIRQYTTNE